MLLVFVGISLRWIFEAIQWRKWARGLFGIAENFASCKSFKAFVHLNLESELKSPTRTIRTLLFTVFVSKVIFLSICCSESSPTLRALRRFRILIAQSPSNCCDSTALLFIEFRTISVDVAQRLRACTYPNRFANCTKHFSVFFFSISRLQGYQIEPFNERAQSSRLYESSCSVSPPLSLQ